MYYFALQHQMSQEDRPIGHVALKGKNPAAKNPFVVLVIVIVMVSRVSNSYAETSHFLKETTFFKMLNSTIVRANMYS